jgi:hypothetical protein
VQQATREKRDAAVDKLRSKYAPRVERATDKIRRTQGSVAKEEQQASQQKLQTAVSFGATLLGAVLGRKAVSMSTLGRATTAARGVSRSMKESGDIAQAQERQREAETELEGAAPEAAIETTEVKAKKTGVDVRLVALVWKPVD